jgi:hypothetical protein
MAVGGKRASFLWTTVTFTSESCIQGFDFNSSLNDIVYQCNGYDKHASGTRVCSFRTSLALNSTDVFTVGLFTPGTTGAWAGYPAGYTTDYIGFTATRGTVISAPISAAPNGILQIDVEIALDDVTYTSL